MNNREVGSFYEEMAVSYLMEHGYHILERNYSHRTGEIDLIAKDGAYYVFIEVKYRTTAQKGYPEEAIDYRKRKHITETARYYLMKHGLSEYTPCRFDVVSILNEEITLIQDAFDATN